ncbi:p21-activated protein kinase-interacting protein 1-like, partial [Pseudolycoriella hygida]
MATDIEIFVGTSQDFLLSFKVKKSDDQKFVLERVIAHRCHNGSIICMDTNGRYLATGGGDDRIVIIDLKLNRDIQEIIRHEGSINSLAFTHKCSDLLSGSDDGRLIATTVGSWKLSNVWKKPHTGKAVLKVCLHESDKFALTLGKDGTLRGWDMIKGTQIKTFNTKYLSDARIVLDNIELCPNGNTFAISGQKTVSLFSFTRTEPYDDLTLNSKVTSLCWLDDENLLVGMEDGSIEWANINASTHVNLPNIHTRRIKGMHFLKGFLGTICSTGCVSLWEATIATKQLTLVCSVSDDSVRPTCIRLIDSTVNRYKENIVSIPKVEKEVTNSVSTAISTPATRKTVSLRENTTKSTRKRKAENATQKLAVFRGENIDDDFEVSKKKGITKKGQQTQQSPASSEKPPAKIKSRLSLSTPNNKNKSGVKKSEPLGHS